MILQPIEKKDYKAKGVAATPSFLLDDGTIGEMVYDGEETKFAISRGGEWRYDNRLALRTGETFLPYSAKNNLIKNRVVLLPSAVVEYDDEGELLERIQGFIHRYVDVSPLFERLCVYYVFFTWIYDDFNELPYLRVLGDAGSGKTRFLLTVGALCHKPIFASGASTVSPLFRALDVFRGTLLIDEGDFPQSDEKAEIVKILNNGNAKGFPVLRSETVVGKGGKEYNPRAYHVYGPKLIATRSLFLDRALESRCLTEEMGHRRLRENVPINLPAAFWREAEQLRNQLLHFRFQHLGKHAVSEALVDRRIEPRLNQVFAPLLSIIEAPQIRVDLLGVMREYHRQFVSDKGMTEEGRLLEVIAERRKLDDILSIKEIAHHFAEKHEAEYDQKVTPKWVGGLIRRRLHLRTERRKEGYVISPGEGEKINRLLERYGLAQSDSPAGENPTEEGREASSPPEKAKNGILSDEHGEPGERRRGDAPTA